MDKTKTWSFTLSISLSFLICLMLNSILTGNTEIENGEQKRIHGYKR